MNINNADGRIKNEHFFVDFPSNSRKCSFTGKMKPKEFNVKMFDLKNQKIYKSYIFSSCRINRLALTFKKQPM